MIQQKLISRILWEQSGKKEMLIAAFSFFIGILLFLLALQLLMDINYLLKSRFSMRESDHLIISKKIQSSLSFNPEKRAFSAKEIDRMKAQDFIQEVQPVIANEFEVIGEAGLGVDRYTSELFFEAVPDSFLEQDLLHEIGKDWNWNEDSDFLPIITSRDFLSLYNFGFAGPRGLPVINNKTVSSINVRIRIYGDNGTKLYKARVVGFTSRISSILVPMDFMLWANDRIANKAGRPPMRLVLYLDNIKDERVYQFLRENNYQPVGDKIRLSDAAFVLKLVFSVVAIIGFFLVFLSMLIFILNSQLIISRSLKEIHILLCLGYKRTILSLNLLFSVFLFLLASLGLGFFLTTLGITQLHQFLQENGIKTLSGLHPLLFFSGLGLFFLILVVNYIVIFYQAGKDFSSRNKA